GAFYDRSPTGDFQGMVEVMKDYVKRRGLWFDRRVIANPQIPATPRLEVPGGTKSARLEGKLVAAVAGAPPEGSNVQCQFGDVRPGKRSSGGTRLPRAYEITPVWQTNGVAKINLPLTNLSARHTYRLRARLVDAAGNAGHYSEPYEFAVEGQSR